VERKGESERYKPFSKVRVKRGYLYRLLRKQSVAMTRWPVIIV